MNDDAINHWIDRAKINESMPKPVSGVKVIKNKVTKTRGQFIMELAERIRPVMQKYLDGRRDRDGMLLQPAHIRAFSLNYAELLVKAQEQDNNAVA